MTFPIDRIRADVPMLARTMYDRPLVYLDTAATALKPQAVIDRLVRFYSHEYATVRRGAYLLSNESTGMYEGVRAQAAAFFGAADPSEIVFVRGVTEAINLFANAWGRANLGPGDRSLAPARESWPPGFPHPPDTRIARRAAQRYSPATQRSAAPQS